MMQELGYGEAKPTKMTLTLAFRSIKYPYGVLEDMLVKVDNLLFLSYFVILYMDEDVEVLILLKDLFLQ